MKRAAIFALATLMSTAAFAGQLIQKDMVRLGSKTIAGGDSVSKVIDAGGQPDGKRDLLNKYGTKIGEEWFYHQGRETLHIFVNGNDMVYNVASAMD
jgi:hypothetical protein